MDSNELAGWLKTARAERIWLAGCGRVSLGRQVVGVVSLVAILTMGSWPADWPRRESSWASQGPPWAALELQTTCWATWMAGVKKGGVVGPRKCCLSAWRPPEPEELSLWPKLMAGDQSRLRATCWRLSG